MTILEQYITKTVNKMKRTSNKKKLDKLELRLKYLLSQYLGITW
jgi:hypothetical protein